MLYYCEYSNGRRYVRAYDEEKHGAPRIVGKSAFLYRGSVSVRAENIFLRQRKPRLRREGNIHRFPLLCLTDAK